MINDIITLYTADFTPTPSLVKYNLHRAQLSNTYTVWHEIFCGLVNFCVLRELIFAIRADWFFYQGINFGDFQKVPSTQH